MRFSPVVVGLLGLALSGCSSADWDHAMTYAGFGEEQAVAIAPAAPRPAPVPVAAAAPDTGFCQAVAKQDSSQNAFDDATRQRVFQRSFQQCMTLFGSPASLRGTLAAN